MATSRARRYILLSAFVVMLLGLVRFLTRGQWPKAKYFVGWAITYMFLSVWCDLKPKEAGNFALLIMATAVLLEGPDAVAALQAAAATNSTIREGTGNTGPDETPAIGRKKWLKGKPPAGQPAPAHSPNPGPHRVFPPPVVPPRGTRQRRLPAPGIPRGFKPWPGVLGDYGWYRDRRGRVWAPGWSRPLTQAEAFNAGVYPGGYQHGNPHGPPINVPGGPGVGPLPIPPTVFAFP
jgi:hypothetical protein